MITFENFHLRSFTVFKGCAVPQRAPDHVSFAKRHRYATVVSGISSQYWFGEDEAGPYVIRQSRHWSGRVGCRKVGRCVWQLDEDADGVVLTGKAYLKDFSLL